MFVTDNNQNIPQTHYFMKRYLLLFVSVVAIHAISYAQLRIPNVLSDNMVLQRNTEANIWGWGWASSTISVTASWLDGAVETQADGGGRWMLQLPTGEAGGPYELTISSGGQQIKVQNILLGDVWVVSGQSNMEWGGNQNLPEILEELPKANDSRIRLLQVSRNVSEYPQDDIPNTWETLSAETLKPFSAIGYFIAKDFRAELDVPVGIINASWGGTAAEVWTPEYLILHDRALRDASLKQGANAYRPHEAGHLWNSMIYPLTPFAISGAFWYQGESNVGTWPHYDKLMRTMVNSWRSAWNNEFPFYFVQIAPFAYNNQLPLASYLREQQERTAQLLPNAAMVVVTDLVDDIKDIHPIQKRAVASRLSKIALNDHYGHRNDRDYLSPVYAGHEIKGNTVTVRFDHLDGGLEVKGNEITELFVAGADRVFHPATGRIKGNTLEVSASQVKNPVAVRFGFTEVAMPNLFNKQGLPVAPFRTDKWNDL